VLVAHFFLAHAAARGTSRLAAAMRSRSDRRDRRHGYAIDVEALARDLGFSRIVANSIDASSDRDFAATFLRLGVAMVHLSRLSEDLIILTRRQWFFELSDALSTGGSA
jgi:argininosuccinate lyase